MVAQKQRQRKVAEEIIRQRIDMVLGTQLCLDVFLIDAAC